MGVFRQRELADNEARQIMDPPRNDQHQNRESAARAANDVTQAD